MLIDYTYFTGKLSLPQTGNTEGREIIDSFIEDYETEFLQKLLGYDLWKDFINGLAEVVINQKWLDLLNGKEFAYLGKNYKWLGFVPLSTGSTIGFDDDNLFTLIVDRGQTYDPVAGSSTFTIPPEFVGENFIVELRGTGTLRPDEYSIVGNVFTLIGDTFNSGATIFLKKGSAIFLGTGTTIKKSPIANYVYYKYMEDKATDNTLVGTVVQAVDNNTRVNAVTKMVDAWNRMVDNNIILWKFMKANISVYPNYYAFQYGHLDGFSANEVYRKKNSLDL